VLDRKAPGLSVLVVPRETVAAVQDAALALGVALGMQMRASAEDLKAARSGMMCDAGGVKAAVAENRRAIGEAPYRWRCDGPTGGL
jgi:hypothetical protein